MRRVAADERRCKRAHNLEVVGSNPVPATKNLKLGGLMASELFYCADGRSGGIAPCVSFCCSTNLAVRTLEWRRFDKTRWMGFQA